MLPRPLDRADHGALGGATAGRWPRQQETRLPIGSVGATWMKRGIAVTAVVRRPPKAGVRRLTNLFLLT